jgi:GT2 family glycosyltransferase
MKTSDRRVPSACTIVSRNYLSHARILAASYVTHHPGARFYLLVIDGLPEGCNLGKDIHLVSAHDLRIPYFSDLCFKYDVTELCTAVKPSLLRLLLEQFNEEQVIYLDPDILVMRPLEELIEGLSQANILLTPHLLSPIPQDGLCPSENDILIAGAYNLGFIGIRKSAVVQEFLSWWEARLKDGCFVDVAQGLMTDQKWIDLVPGMFPTTVLKDDTYNVAYWNIHSRLLERRGADYLVNGRPVAFFHFSGFNPSTPSIFSKHQNRTTAPAGSALHDLLSRYVALHHEHGFSVSRRWEYGYGVFDNGVKIGLPLRRLYRELSPNERAAFGNPFETTGRQSFLQWATSPARDAFSPFALSIYRLRPDVAAAYPDIYGKDKQGFLSWLRTSGSAEFGYDARAMRLIDGADEPGITSPRRDNRTRCSVIIPVHNKASLTNDCLNHVFATLPPETPVEVLVVNDASSDNTSDVLRQFADRIRIVTHEANCGFAVSCNDAAAIAKGDYLVFLNNDTIPRPGWLAALLSYADSHPNAAALGSKLLFPNETIQHAGIVICEDATPRHIYSGFPAAHPAVNRSRKLQAVTGACLLVRRDDFDGAGGFDATFKNGYEDVDLCLRIGERGREVHYCHESELVHLEAISREESQRQNETRNASMFRQRWSGRINSDELQCYMLDGLLTIEHNVQYPFRLSISPLLATIKADRQHGSDRLLETRSHQVLGLLKDNIRLTVRAQEAEARSRAVATWTGGLSNVSPAELRETRVLFQGRVQWLSEHPTKRLLSIILPVKNGAHKLRELLPAIKAQKSRDLIEIIAVDSQSEDESVELLKRANATVISIDPRAFNHGLTRNLATRYANGSIFVFLNQSTLPADAHWLANLVRPFDNDEALAGVCGRVLPRKDADLLTAHETIRNINASEERIVTRITDWDAYRSLKPEILRAFVNFHTLSAAIRADVFQRVPFREANFAEDLIWGKEALESGLLIQYEPLSVALHSHNYSLLEILRRNFDDGVACQKIIGRTLAQEEVADRILGDIRNTWRYLEQDCSLQKAELETWRVQAAARHTLQTVGQWLGVNSRGSHQDLEFLLSITEQIKRGVRTEISEGSMANARSSS